MTEYSGLTLIPPKQASCKIDLDIRVGVCNELATPQDYRIRLYLDSPRAEAMIAEKTIVLDADSSQCVRVDLPLTDYCGDRKIIAEISSSDGQIILEESIEVVDSATPSTGRVAGAWTGITHWSEREGRLWNDEIKKMSDDEWRQLVRAMHEVGMDVIVIQELFRNEEYVGKHNIEADGYHGKCYYDSPLVPGRMEIAANDPVEAILSQADELGMKVFPGVGLYAWFDFTPASLEWHKRAALDIWQRYGHHPSLYGWYVSEEIFGDLGYDDQRREELVDFFRQFKAFTGRLTPDKPTMLATNSHWVDKANGYYPALCENLDILCPFGFARQPEGDMSGPAAAAYLQEICNEAGNHLWMDMEVFLFDDKDQALYPKTMEDVKNELEEYVNFESVLCYQFPGLMNAPWMTRKPGGPVTVELFEKYKTYIEGKK